MAKEIDVKHLAIVGPKAEKIDGKFYVTLASGEKRGPFPYMVDPKCEGAHACVMLDNYKYKYIAFDGKESAEFDDALPFTDEGYAIVQPSKNSKVIQNYLLTGFLGDGDKFVSKTLMKYIQGKISLEKLESECLAIFEEEGMFDFIRRVEVNKMDYNYTKRLLNRRMKKEEVDAKIAKRVLEVDGILQTQREKIAKRKSIEEIKLGR